MARRRVRRRKSSSRGGAGAPAKCKSALKQCLIQGPALSGRVARVCFKAFNKCRSKRRGRR